VFEALHLIQNASTNPWEAGSDAIGDLFAEGEQDSMDPLYSR
jgi:hypothetical protein